MLQGGGFSFENRCLLAAIGEHVRPVYLATVYGGTPGEPGIPSGNAYAVPLFASQMKRSFTASIFAFVKTFFVAYRVIQKERVNAVAVIGCSHSVPILAAARLTGCRTAFIESITRADRLSRTGQIVYSSRLASVFIVQWPSLQAAYPASRLGTIL